MQIHIHIGDDTRTGKTLSSLISLVLLNSRAKVIVFDIDTFGAKIARILSPLAAENRDLPDKAYGISGTQVYVANYLPNESLGISAFELQGILEQLSSCLQKDSEDFEFEHVIIDTNDSFIKYSRLEAPLNYLDTATCLKFWINHNHKMLEEDYKVGFWNAFRKIKEHHPKLRTHLFHIFNPVGILSRQEFTTKVSNGRINNLLQSVSYKRLVEMPFSDLALPTERIIHNPSNHHNLNSLDQELLDLLTTDSNNVGKRLAQLWKNNHDNQKPQNVVFVPVEPRLTDYRSEWDPVLGHPLIDLQDLRSRMGEVFIQSLVAQWNSLLELK